MNILAFRLFGDFAHFRPYYTTSSPTTYSLMPPTSVIGMVGAILGLEKEENRYYTQLEEREIKVGICLEKPITKVMMSTNLINTKGNYWVPTGRNSNGPRTPTRYEYVRQPEYMIYVTMKDTALLDELAERVKHHCLAYTVSLGLANLIADVSFAFYEEAVYKQEADYVEMDSAVPLSALTGERPIQILPDIQYCKEQYVKSFFADRVPAEYVDILFSVNGKKVSVMTKGYYEVGNRKILLMNE